MKTVLFVVGPTACGKSDLAVAVCEALAVKNQRAEIINSDSVQFFAGVEIGAAKPGPELLSRATHHLVGTVPLGEPFTAGDFRRRALEIIDRREAERFVAVGGSGFYVQALDKGMYDVPEVPDEIRRAVEGDLEARGLPALYEELRVIDAASAARIQPNDRYRVLRALEILRAQPGTTLSEIRERFAESAVDRPFRSVKIGLTRSRQKLRERITERTKSMLASGLLKEVEALRAQGLSEWWPMKSVGYKEAQDFLDGSIASLAELEAAIVTSTMQLAKRQMTWFKRDPEISWFDIEDGMSAPLEKAQDLLA